MEQNPKNISQVEVIKGFNRNIWLFLLSTFINGIMFSIWWLFFNFYILELGFDREFLGLTQSVTAAATLVLGIPLGLLSDRIGRKKSMLIGVTLYGIASALEVLIPNPYVILTMAFFSGAGHTLYFISQPPFMMRLSNAQNRTLLFSINFGLITLSGAGGNLLAGYLPSVFGGLLGVSAESAIAYRMVLLSAVMLSFLTLIPLALIRNYPERSQSSNSQDESLSAVLKSLRETVSRPMNLKLLLPNLPLGFGAAILIPYMNLYFVEKFGITDIALGVVFSLSSLLTGIGSLLGPRLSTKFNSKIKAVVLTQTLSILFLVLLGISTNFQIAVIAFLLRGSLMNMSVPLFDTFTMENVREREQATVVSLRELFWQMGWTFGPYISGVVQEVKGFTPLFIATSILYAVSTGSIWFFFRDSE